MSQTASDLQSYADKASRLSGWQWDIEISRVGPDWAWDYVELARGHLRGPIGLGYGYRRGRGLRLYDRES